MKCEAKMAAHGGQFCTSELDFHVWNANWTMKSEAKIAAHEGQFCTSLLVPYAGL